MKTRTKRKMFAVLRFVFVLSACLATLALWVAGMIAISIMHYNFCRIHQTLRVTPAMEAGLAGHVWEIGELLSPT